MDKKTHRINCKRLQKTKKPFRQSCKRLQGIKKLSGKPVKVYMQLKIVHITTYKTGFLLITLHKAFNTIMDNTDLQKLYFMHLITLTFFNIIPTIIETFQRYPQNFLKQISKTKKLKL